MQELIFAEEGLFEISENKNPLKIMRYTVCVCPPPRALITNDMHVYLIKL